MKILISDHFTLKKLIKFVAPSIIMMIFTSVYCVVDGFFVSNYAGKIQFAAVNLIMPFMMLPGAFGFMIGTGGNAIVSKTLGEGNKKKANEIFSMLVYILIAVGSFGGRRADATLLRNVRQNYSDDDDIFYDAKHFSKSFAHRRKAAFCACCYRRRRCHEYGA